MPKILLEAELNTIEKIIEGYPLGVRMDELLKAHQVTMPRRTLQRRLKLLIKQGRLIMLGSGAGSKYQLPLSTAVTYGEFKIPLSNESRLIRDYVNQPLEDRKAVTYNRQFLDNYCPNDTHYLSSHLCEHLKKIGSHSSSEQIAGTYARKILGHLLIDLSWNSSRLEGNTYSLLETERLLEFGEKSENKSTTDTQMILNHKAAIEFLIDSAESIAFNGSTILNLHALLADNLLSNPAACGRLRTIPVVIGKTSYTPSKIPQLIEECFYQILAVAGKIQNPFEQSFFIMVHLPYLQPFEDVNKRVSRLSANIPLIQNNLSPLSFIDVPEKAYIDAMLGVYESNRYDLLKDLFVWAYERSAARYKTTRQILGEPDPFRLKYRQELIKLIGEIVGQGLGDKASVSYIQNWVENHILDVDQARFKEITETELLSLHSGNIARFRIKPSEFEHWYQQRKKNRPGKN